MSAPETAPAKPVPLAPRFEAIPPALRASRSWVTWRYELRDRRWTKPPRRASDGGFAKTNDPTTWADFETAQLAAAHNDGVGVVLTGDLIGLDLDHVLSPDTGEVERWASLVLERFAGCYVERSPGGDGLRIFCRGTVHRSGKAGPANHLEVYGQDSPRYLTVTGHRFRDGEVIDAQEALDWLHEHYFDSRVSVDNESLPTTLQSGSLTDDEVLRRAREAANGAKFLRLWAGDQGDDASAADAALIGILKFWTRDAAQLDRLFRRSGLMRAKWDGKRGAQTYGELTIRKVLDMGGDQYGRSMQGRAPSTGEAGGREDCSDPPVTVWPDPRPIKADLPPAPAFDAHALLPKVLADFVLDEADRMPCAPDYIAAALIVAIGSVLGARCALKPKRRDDWIVTANLFGGLVGEPSSKKTPACSTVMRFLDRLEAGEEERHAEEAKIYEAELAAFEARKTAIQSAMKFAARSKDGTDKMEEATREMTDLTPPDAPVRRRYKISDATVAMLGELLVRNPAGLFVFRDEITGLLSSWDREGNEGDRAFYLEGWNGVGSFSVHRISRGSSYIPNLCLSVFGGIQPDLMARYLAGSAAGLDNDGRVQRFQVLVYPEAVKWEWRDRYPVKGARQAVREIFERLSVFDPLQDGAEPETDFVKLPYFMFDDAAQEVFVEWCTELNTVRIPGEPSPLTRQHLAKYEKLFCAVALILHLADGNIGPVKVESALRAAAWAQYLEGHARRIYGLVEVGRVSSAQLLGRRIKAGKLADGFTARDVVRKGWTGLETTTQVDAALGLLEEHGWVVAVETNNSSGRPTIRHHINPKIKAASP